MSGEKPKWVNFLFGGLSGMGATCVVQPLDLLKTRMQMSGLGGKHKEHRTSFHAAKSIIEKEGFFAIYTGLSAALLRQATYTTTRLGVYTYAFEMITLNTNAPPNFAIKTALGMCAGIAGAFIGTPADVALIRMTSDGRLPEAERLNYKSVFHALFRIAKEDGVTGLWRGAIPTMGRAMVVNGSQLAIYSQSKQMLLESGHFGDNIKLHFAASMISGLVTTAVSLPVDIAKTRIQNMKIVDGKPEYHGTLDVLLRVIRNEGPPALWKGFTPYYARIGPHTVLTFIFLEQFHHWYNRHHQKNK